jgi:hypothetical protein
MKKVACFTALLATGVVSIVSISACTSASEVNAAPNAGTCTQGTCVDAGTDVPSSPPGPDANESDGALPPPEDTGAPPPPVDAGADTGGDAGVIVGCIPQEVSTRYDATWLFGHGCRADWNAQNQLTLATSPIVFTGFEGTISAANAVTGQLFATSDGINLYDGTGTKTNTVPLGGNASASQPVAFIGKPGSASDFYVLANAGAAGGTPPAGLFVTALPCGQLTPAGAPTLVLGTESFTEALATVRHANNVDRWVLGVAPTGIAILAVTSSGFGAPAITPWGGVIAGPAALQRAYISFARDRHTFAITMENVGLVTGTFDNAAGSISNLKKIALPANTSLYSVAFSPDGTKLYASEWSGRYWQIDLGVLGGLDGGTDAGVAVTDLGASGGALRLAIDDKLYLTTYAATSLTVISNPNAPAAQLQTGTLPLPATCTATYGFPGIGDL